MKKLIIIVLLSTLGQGVKAHNPAVASFYIFQMKDEWQMRVEFAWSLRNALTKSFPYLSEEKGLTDQDYMDCVADYLDIHLELSADEERLQIASIQQIPGDHGHSYTFIIGLQGKVNASTLLVKNQCLTELYRKQKNEVYLTTNTKTENRLLTKQNDEHLFVLEG